MSAMCCEVLEPKVNSGVGDLGLRLVLCFILFVSVGLTVLASNPPLCAEALDNFRSSVGCGA